MALQNGIKLVLITFLAVFAVNFANANPTTAENVAEKVENNGEEEFNVSEMIMHHIKDAHEWHLWGGEHDGATIYLPIILIDGGLKVFSSSHFYHGEIKTHYNPESKKTLNYIVGVGPAVGYAMYHEEIYKLEGTELHFEGDHVHGAVTPLDFSLTKNVVFMFIAVILLLIIMFSVRGFYRKNGAVAPKGIAKFVEPLIVFVRDDIAKENIDHHKYHKYLPYLLTVFFFILICNLLGSIPLIGANLTGNISVTLFLAACTLVLTVLSGNKAYWKHIFWPPGVPVALMPIMIPLEIVGVFTKPIALMIRLFANITAGHIIILALISIIFINKNIAWGGLSVPLALFISVLELLVAFLQAYLFTLLSALFIGAAVQEHHH
jgi:F-type H+-transporting ATPase subunit a